MGIGINIHTKNTFTQTMGVPGEISKEWDLKVDKDFIGIKSLESFKSEYRNKKGQIHGKYISWLNFLENIGNKLEKDNGSKIDPIEYLIHLYHNKEEGIGYDDIDKRFGNLGTYKNPETLRRFFVNILGWKSRESNDRTEYSKRKNKNTKNISGLEEKNKEKTLKSRERFNRSLIQILEESDLEKQDIEFDLEIYKSKWIKEKGKKIQGSKKKQNIYLISTILSIKESSIRKLLKEINLVSGHGAIAKGLNERMNEKGIDTILLEKGDIRHIVN